MKKYKALFSTVLLLLCSCIAGAGFDCSRDIRKAENWPAVYAESVRIEEHEIPFRTYTQTFNRIFDDFPFVAQPIKRSSTHIPNTPYDVSYNNFILEISRQGKEIVRLKLPNVFYMHPLLSCCLRCDDSDDDIILVCIRSRATTGLVYIGAFSGKGEILISEVLGSGDVWDIKYINPAKMIVGGAKSQLTILFE